MKIMEKDAEARRLKRMKREKVANGALVLLSKSAFLAAGSVAVLFLSVATFLLSAALKDKGNEAYARGEYRTAVQFYTDGLAELRDMKPLYTNRAQVRKKKIRAVLMMISVSALLCANEETSFPPQLANMVY